jgi:putative membrane protein
MSTTDLPAQAQPYVGLSPDELILRDRLAIDRTILANERTLLAYARTALALLIAGLSLIHLPFLSLDANLDVTLYAVAGWLCVGVGAIVVIIGYVHYRKYRAHIRAVGSLSPASRQSTPSSS